VQVTKGPGDGAGLQAKAGGRFRPLRSGFYELANDPRRTVIAVNTEDVTQSDLRRSAAGPAAEATRVASAPEPGVLQSAAWLVWPLWIYFALLAVLLSGLEWWMYHQRRTE
jgi:hypothetical protein